MSIVPVSTILLVSCLSSLSLAAVTTPAAAQSAEKSTPAAAATHWWSAATDQALAHAGANQSELVKALETVPAAQRDGMEFLVANMPISDLTTLKAAFLLENVAIAYQAYDTAPWKALVPREVFLNEILPYASLNEARDDSRKMLRDTSLPLIAGCTTAAEAAQALNRKLFPLVKVKYSTQRNRPDQAPTETIASGMATCSGLSILLVDACRAVGIPARIVGVPNWADNRGNHTWVEVWDGDWHFAGAAEPDDKGLDHGWFTGDAARAKGDDPEHAIYASSFARTGTAYPLVWDRDNLSIPAVNVTKRYVPAEPAAEVPANTTQLRVQVVDSKGQRVVAQVVVRDIAKGAVRFTGDSKSETADRNDYLTFNVPREREYEIAATTASGTVRRPYHAGSLAAEIVTINARVAPHATKPISAIEWMSLNAAFKTYLSATPERQKAIRFDPALDKLLLANEPVVRQVAWEVYKSAPIHAELKAAYDAKEARFTTYVSPYTLKYVGTRPANGWPLFIAMHGGGNAPKELNDSQWKQMQNYYRDHPELGGYEYLALRAPNDTWNGFYDVYVYPLIHNLVKQFLLFGDTDPNKVFIMGYSHGGYGAYAIGPKEPDLFAAIHASAAAATDGETTPITLRNTIFTNLVGGLDTDYGRLDRDKKFLADVAVLRGDRNDIYPVQVDVSEGVTHSRLKDHDKIVDMYPAVRNPVPRELTWRMTDTVIADFFWLRTTAPAKELEIDAACEGNHITVTTKGAVTAASVLLDSRLVDFSKPVTMTLNGVTTTQRLAPSLKTLCDTLLERGDPDRAFTAEIGISR